MRVTVIGGGAAGMTAAIVAARKGAEVTLIEQHPRVGKKLLTTGNGRCNMLNTLSIERKFHGSGAKVAYALLGRYPPDIMLAFWESMGLFCRVEDMGRVYPASGNANAVLDILRLNLARAGVAVLTDRTAINLTKDKDGFAVKLCPCEVIRADRVIVATGGKAGISERDATGYELLRKFGVHIIPLGCALAPIKVEADAIRGLKGVRVRVGLSLMVDGEVIESDTGEILFGDNAVSGIVSTSMSYAVHDPLNSGRRVELSIDLLPERSVDEWRIWLESQKPAPDELTIDILRGLIHSRVAQCVIRAAGLDSRTLASDCSWIRIAQCLRDWRMTVTGTENLARSQVTTGGADMSAFNPDTLECLGAPGLYAIGEIHDVDAACGGFNLMWAWVSGIVAGEAAAGTAQPTA